MMEMDRKILDAIVRSALKEDIGPLDVTTAFVVPKGAFLKADIITREDGVACGLVACEAVFEYLDKDVKFRPQVKDGDAVYADKVLCYIEGPARPILTGERTALNLLSRLSGIASATNRFAKKCEPYGVKVMDTRKTTPGLRYLEKCAVRAGGGYNHRMGLWDQILIKDNHLKLVSRKPEDISNILKDIKRKAQKNTKIEIEVGSIEEFAEALKARPDIIMLDNMSPEDVRRAVDIRKKKGVGSFLEVSGRITLDNIEEYAKAKPDMISVGSITHSVKSLDLSMEVYG